jgi:sugar/nucleoside kinase (ribokinase family)
MSILVVGSVAFDSIQTPHGSREKCLGGAATHFSLAASFFTDVRVIAVVGSDFTEKEESVLTKRGIDTQGIERAHGYSFHWSGSYMGDLNEAQTLKTDLNVFEHFNPKVPKAYLDSDYLFLANIDPVLQLRVRQQMPNVKLVAGDTMNYWINDHQANLEKVLRELDILLINDKETRMLAGCNNLLRASTRVLEMGPEAIVIKHGEYGATSFFNRRIFETGLHSTAMFHSPALPLSDVVDPTGAGDSFAGGFYGYLASQPTLSPEVFKRAMFYGGVMGSFCCENFGTERVQSLTREEIDQRFAELEELSHIA